MLAVTLQRQDWHQVLQRSFGLTEFRKGQRDILESVVGTRDSIAVLPTGGGKSLCYQLPSQLLNGLVIVVSPLIALMKDQVKGLREHGIAAGCLYSGQTMDEKRAVFTEMRLSRAFILYLSPERVQNPGFAEWLKTREVKLFAIDEAHCVSQWGPDFRPDYAKLSLLRTLKPEVPILALTATATPQVLNDISRQLQLRKPDRHVHGFYRSNLYFQVETCSDDQEKGQFVEQAIRRTPKGRVLVYCGTRAQSEQLCAHLQAEFEGVGYYHAGLSTADRNDIQKQIEDGKLRILIATNAFGMGINYPDVRLVIHFQMPSSIEAFYQEMGRAGRDGKPSLCLLLYAKKDRGLHSFFIQQSKAEQNVIRTRWNSLQAITQFVEGGECRHAGILTYFRDSERIKSCGHCDACAPEADLRVKIVRQAPTTASLRIRRKSATKAAGPKRSFNLEGSDAEARAILLRQWRKDYALEHDIPAFVVFSDRTLTDLANRNPQSTNDFMSVYGFGEKKTEVLAEKILDYLKQGGR